MGPPKIRTLFKPTMTWRQKKRLQHRQTWQDCCISLTGAEEHLHNFGWSCWLTGQWSTEAEGGLGDFFFLSPCKTPFLYFRRKFPPSKLDHSQIKSDKKSTPNPTPMSQPLVRELHQSLWSCHLLGWWTMGHCIRQFSNTGKIQILSLWSTLLIEITSGLQIPSCFGLPSSALLWSRGLAESKIKD